MANLRVVYDNAANRATISASTTAGTLVASNLQNDLKSKVWRSTSTTASLTLTWSAAETIKVVALPFASLTGTATMQIQGYTNVGDASPVFDTGALSCRPATSLTGLPLSVNSYGVGGGTYAVLWFTGAAVKKLVVTLVDSSNSNGYVEASRVVCGNYWSPSINCEYGVNLGITESSKHERSDAGDLRTDVGCRYKTMSLDLTLLPTTDRDSLFRILMGNGMTTPVFLSISPQDTDQTGEFIYQLYGKISRSSALKYQFYNQFNSTIELEEV